MSQLPFRFALVGFSEEVTPLLEAMAESSRYQLAAACDLAGHDAEVRQWHPLVTLEESWESLLHGTQADAVLVTAGPGADREDALRKLVQHRIPLLVLHPACDMLLGLELLMIQRDTQGVIVPYVAGLLNSALPSLGAWDSGGTTAIGTIQQCEIE